MLDSIFIYNTVLIISVLFAWFGSQENPYRKLFIIVSFSSLFLLSFLRFNVGHDYANYLYGFKDVYNEVDFEWTSKFSYYLVCKLFSFSPRGYIFVFGFYSFFCLWFLFKTLIKREILPLGVFIFICFGYLFTTFDQIRQTTSIFIFLYAIRYLERDDFKKFFFTLLFAAFFHFSALFLIPVFFLRKIKINITLWGILIGIFLLGYFTRIWEGLRLMVFNLIPIYRDLAQMQGQLESQELSTGLGLIYIVFTISLVIYFRRKKENQVLTNLAGLGLLIFLFSSGNLNIDRFSNYFLMSQVISIPLIIREQRNQILSTIILLSALILFQVNIIQSPRGSTPYQSVFHKNYLEEFFSKENL